MINLFRRLFALKFDNPRTSHRWLIIRDVDWTFEFWVKTFEITSASMLITKIDNMCWCCDGQLRYFSLFHSNIKIGLVLDEKHQVLVFCSWSYFEISTWDRPRSKMRNIAILFLAGIRFAHECSRKPTLDDYQYMLDVSEKLSRIYGQLGPVRFFLTSNFYWCH